MLEIIMVEKEETTTSTSNGRVQEQVEADVAAAWGTLEELLLVCAVNRHGTNSWDTISKLLLQHHHRPLLQNNNENFVLAGEKAFSPENCCKQYNNLKRRFKGREKQAEKEQEDEINDEALRMIEELRKVRVEELKRQVHNHDVSIVSLQMKLKKLKDEREITKPENKPEENAGKMILTVDSAENRSLNESNSAPTREPDRVYRKRREVVSQLGELGESVSESKKKRRRYRGGGSSGEEAEEVSPANKIMMVKSQPLIRFLDILRAHKHGSVFQRRLPSQETEKYRNVVRQHMDLDMVQSRLDKGNYSECHLKFYRDLLLVFTNSVLFYRKSSAEHIAARELRKLVIEEITVKTRKPKIQPTKPDLEIQAIEPVVKKPRSSTIMVVCRRRSNSSSMQALSETLKKKEDANGTKTQNSISELENGCEETAKADHHRKKKTDGGSNNNGKAFASLKYKESDEGVGGATNTKKLLKMEQSTLGRGTLRLSNNNSKKIIISKEGNKREKMGNDTNNNNNNNNIEESSEGDQGVEPVKRKKIDADHKQEKGTTVLKKQGVVNFLKRMKQNSPSSQDKAKNGDSNKEEDDDEKEKIVRRLNKDTASNNGKKTSGNSKRNNSNNNKDIIEGSVTRRTAGRKGEKELAASRRAIGRPPKRKAARMGGSTPDSGKGGRSGGRDSGEKKKKPRR